MISAVAIEVLLTQLGCGVCVIVITGVDLSIILGANQNIGGGQRVEITDESIGATQLLGHVTGLPPQSL